MSLQWEKFIATQLLCCTVFALFLSLRAIWTATCECGRCLNVLYVVGVINR